MISGSLQAGHAQSALTPSTALGRWFTALQHLVKAATMRVNRLDHINIRTPILKETVAFYERLLGLKAGCAPGIDSNRYAWLADEAGNNIVHVNMPAGREDPLPTEQSGRLHHVAPDCDGYDDMVARLFDMGVSHDVNEITAIGLRQVFILHPNGLRIELNFRS